MRSRTPYGFIQKIAVLYIIIWTISPFMEIDMKWRFLALGSAGLWFLLELSNGIVLGRIQIYAISFAIIVAAVAYFETGSFSGVLKQIAIYLLVVCFLINFSYQERWFELSNLVPIILLVLLIFNFRSARAVIADPTLARKIVRNDESMYPYLRQGIGGYSLIYSQVVIFPAIVAWTTRAFRKSKVLFILGVMWFGSYSVFVLNAGYSTAIAASIIGLIMLYFYKGKNAIGAFIVALIIFLIGMWAILYSDGFRNMLLNFFDGTAVVKKINDLVASAQVGEAEGSIYSRISAYQGSFDTIFKYPVIGSLWNASGGGHSALLDVFAKYGILGGYIYAKMLYYVPNYYKATVNNKYIRSVSNATLVTMMFVSVLDSCTYAFMGMMLLVLPLLYENIMDWSGIK